MNALVACHRAYHAWIRTQPQLVIPGVLDEPEQRSALLRFVEPAGMSRRLPPGGLTNGATDTGASVAPLQSDGTDRRTSPGSRGRCQKGA